MGIDQHAIRSENMAYLRSRGFRPATWLPLDRLAGGGEPAVRRADDIAGRLWALSPGVRWEETDLST